jgi:hypothetical protein
MFEILNRWRIKRQRLNEAREIANSASKVAAFPDPEVLEHLKRIKSAEMQYKAIRKGIEINPQWIDQKYSSFGYVHKDGYLSHNILTQKGEYELIYQLNKRQRENIDWWLNKLIIPVLVTIASFVGALVGAWMSLNKQ